MKTLIIHPEDRSTEFLKPIYENIEDKTVVTGDYSKKELFEAILNHDRIMMMGHGSPSGLFGINRFKMVSAFVIDQRTVHLLKQKENSVFVWCHANEFVDRHNLNGFYSGMFVSEVTEARYCGISSATQEEVTLSNDTFAKLLGENINNDSKTIHKIMKEAYGKLADTSNVASYNQQRLYFRNY